jgi:glycosyltransferase involved in cell wall biosynthesis
MARVSIIVPTYNAAAFLPEALGSVLRQTYRHWEVVVVDDGSTDATRSVVEAQMPSFGGRLRYLYQENRGAAAARNTAIRACRGELIALLDADDVWLDNRLDRGVDTLDQNPEVGLVHAQVMRIDRDGKLIGRPPAPPKKYLSGKIAGHIYSRRAHLLCPTILFRRRCLDVAGYFDENTVLRATEDRDLWFRIARLFPIAYLAEVLAYYRILPNSLSRDWNISRDAQLFFFQKHRLAGYASARDYRQGLANFHRERGDELFKLGALGESLRWYAKSVSYDPGNGRNVYMLVRALAEPLLTKVSHKYA